MGHLCWGRYVRIREHQHQLDDKEIIDHVSVYLNYLCLPGVTKSRDVGKSTEVISYSSISKCMLFSLTDYS